MLSRRGFLAGLGILVLEGCGVYSPGFKFFEGIQGNFVFSHGFLQSIDQLKDYSDFLLGKGYGSLLWSYPDRNSVKGLSEDLRNTVVDNNIEKPVLFGCSMGGIVSMQYAVDYPEDYSGLVLVSSANKVREDNPLGSGEILFGTARDLFGDILSFYVEPEIIKKPVLHFHGNRDEFFSNESVDEFLNGLSGKYRRVVFENEGHDIVKTRRNEITDFIGNNLDIFES